MHDNDDPGAGLAGNVVVMRHPQLDKYDRVVQMLNAAERALEADREGAEAVIRRAMCDLTDIAYVAPDDPEPGFYWVKVIDEWYIGQFRRRTGWDLLGLMWDDSLPIEIGDRIEEPKP